MKRTKSMGSTQLRRATSAGASWEPCATRAKAMLASGAAGSVEGMPSPSWFTEAEGPGDTAQMPIGRERTGQEPRRYETYPQPRRNKPLTGVKIGSLDH